jgi:tRNA dimethylallyltransferase
MLYFRALMHGIAPLPEADPALRARLDERARQHGWPALHAELALRDPLAAARIRPADRQRIQRALEVLELTGRPLSELQRLAEPSPLRFAAFALLPPDRPLLYRRIDERFRSMIDEGLLDEVRALRARGDLQADLPSLRSVGYRQLWRYLETGGSLETAIEDAQRATRNLAKRQFTWLRAEPAWGGLAGLEEQELVAILRVMGAVSARRGASTSGQQW